MTDNEWDLDTKVAFLEGEVKRLQSEVASLAESFNTFLQIMLKFMDNPKVKAAFEVDVPRAETAKPRKAVPKPGPPKK